MVVHLSYLPLTCCYMMPKVRRMFNITTSQKVKLTSVFSPAARDELADKLCSFLSLVDTKQRTLIPAIANSESEILSNLSILRRGIGNKQHHPYRNTLRSSFTAARTRHHPMLLLLMHRCEILDNNNAKM